MTLENLAKLGQLHPYKSKRADMQRLLSAVDRNLIDADRAENSLETRFDCAYKASMQCALIAIMASGYRPSTGVPGHHQTLIQSLPLALGVGNETWIPLDGIRKKRNLSDYTGAPTSQTETEEAVLHAKALLARLLDHLKPVHPGLLM